MSSFSEANRFISIPSDGFVQVENRAGDGGHGGKLRRIRVLRQRRISHVDELAGIGGRGFESGQALAVQIRERGALLLCRLAAQGAQKGPIDLLRGAAAAMVQNVLREYARGLHVDR